MTRTGGAKGATGRGRGGRVGITRPTPRPCGRRVRRARDGHVGVPEGPGVRRATLSGGPGLVR